MPLDRHAAIVAWRYLRDHDEYQPAWARFRHVYEDRAKVGQRTVVPELLAHLPERMSPEASAEYRARRAGQIAERKEADLRAQAVALRTSSWTPLRGDFDALTPMLTYDEVYTKDGTPRPEHEAAVREYARRWPVA